MRRCRAREIVEVIGDGPQADAVHLDDEHVFFGADCVRERAVDLLKRGLRFATLEVDLGAQACATTLAR